MKGGGRKGRGGKKRGWGKEWERREEKEVFFFFQAEDGIRDISV